MIYGEGTKFDREHHRFGMAYECSRDHGKPYYVTGPHLWTGVLGGTCECVDANGKNMGAQWMSELSRWPLHDMLPALQVALDDEPHHCACKFKDDVCVDVCCYHTDIEDRLKTMTMWRDKAAADAAQHWNELLKLKKLVKG